MTFHIENTCARTQLPGGNTPLTILSADQQNIVDRPTAHTQILRSKQSDRRLLSSSSTLQPA